MHADLSRRLAAEALGTGLLVATVVGSGTMAERLAGDVAVALLGNTLPTGAILFVLITLLGPISGAHFNPAVTVVMALRRALPWSVTGLYVGAQIVGGVAGTVIAHLMFEVPALMLGDQIRTGAAQWLSEGVATFGLLLTILIGLRHKPTAVPALVACYIVAAYWFTSSTSFANPAVAIARAFTDTFSGIRPIDVPLFIGAQFAGAILAMAVSHWLLSKEQSDMSVTIYHNPDCGTSRNTLEMIRQSGIEPTVIEYLKTPPDRETVIKLLGDAGLSVRDALRQKDTPFEKLGLGDPAKSDDELLDAMETHPILLNRPFVVTPIGTKLCRPSEIVLDILENPDIGPFTKEDGEVVIDAEGKRLV